MKGTIKILLTSKGCGFITGADNIEYFFHASGLKNIKYEELRKDDEVTFEETETAKGPRAEEIYV